MARLGGLSLLLSMAETMGAEKDVEDRRGRKIELMAGDRIVAFNPLTDALDRARVVRVEKIEPQSIAFAKAGGMPDGFEEAVFVTFSRGGVEVPVPRLEVFFLYRKPSTREVITVAAVNPETNKVEKGRLVQAGKIMGDAIVTFRKDSPKVSVGSFVEIAREIPAMDFIHACERVY